MPRFARDVSIPMRLDNNPMGYRPTRNAAFGPVPRPSWPTSDALHSKETGAVNIRSPDHPKMQSNQMTPRLIESTNKSKSVNKTDKENCAGKNSNLAPHDPELNVHTRKRINESSRAQECELENRPFSLTNALQLDVVIPAIQ